MIRLDICIVEPIIATNALVTTLKMSSVRAVSNSRPARRLVFELFAKRYQLTASSIDSTELFGVSLQSGQPETRKMNVPWK
jgi:hypothetical protein